MKTLATAFALLLLATGCDGGESTLGPPTGGADYSGSVIQVKDGSALVRTAGDTCGIWVSQADSVQVLTADGADYAAASWDDLLPGMYVQLWIPGGIAESCPMQGAAHSVVIAETAHG